MVDPKDRAYAILYKLQRKAALTDEELRDLQSHIDELELKATTPHHDTHSHGSEHHHDTHHHGLLLEPVGETR